MSGTGVDFGALERIARSLDTGAAGLESCGGSAPAGVDGGELSALLNSMVAKVSESAGGLSEGMMAAGVNVRASSSAYVGTDHRSAQGLGSLGAPHRGP